MAIRRFNEGDLVVLKDIDFIRKNRNVSAESLEKFERYYNYIKSKEPLKIEYFWEPGELIYDEEFPIKEKRGKPTDVYYYNIQTPRSKLYDFEDCELEPYIEEVPDSK